MMPTAVHRSIRLFIVLCDDHLLGPCHGSGEQGQSRHRGISVISQGHLGCHQVGQLDLRQSLLGQVLADPGLQGARSILHRASAKRAVGISKHRKAALNADVHCAKSAGLDYFIFGYYLESSAWGRDQSTPWRSIAPWRILFACPTSSASNTR